MEPMTLGSPSGSGSPAYLPFFLLGDPQAEDKGRVSFAATSPQNFNRSSIGQKVGTQYQQTPPQPPSTPTTHQPSGPPTTGLFDALHNEMQQIGTPRKDSFQSPKTQMPSHQHLQNTSVFGMDQSFNAYNDSYMRNNASFNASHQILSPLSGGTLLENSQQTNMHNNFFWITVFGFPPSASSSILQHFTICGTIVDKIIAKQNGNWMHIKFSARSECDRALNYNEKILFNNIMIGVTQCRDRSVLDKENLSDVSTFPTYRARPLAQTAYKAAQSETSAICSPVRTLRPSGIVNKAMELFFNW